VEFPEEIYAKTIVPVKIRLINNKSLMPAFLIKVLVEQQEILFSFIEAKSDSTHYLNLCFEKRGRYRIDRIYLSSVFPFNFFVRYKKNITKLDLIIFPQPKKCDWNHVLSRHKKPKGDEHSKVAGYDSDIISIRDYVSGDPLKYISWKSTAKTDSLKTKELSSLEFQPIIIEFNKINIGDIELKISFITFIILKLFRSGTPFGLSIDEEIYNPENTKFNKMIILKRLALYGQN
jgi:uncharacterized protein (DUF58 family)